VGGDLSIDHGLHFALIDVLTGAETVEVDQHLFGDGANEGKRVLGGFLGDGRCAGRE
jgi:hypothetical protein